MNADMQVRPRLETASAPSAAAEAAPETSARFGPLYWLALGTFAVGTEGFMVAAILPKIAGDFARSIETTGLLVTVFTLAYALSSPILTALAGNLERRRLLLTAMAVFAGANLFAALAPSFGVLMVARVLLAFAAGLYVPNANALASVVVPAAHRGRALAIVNGGLTVAVALGVPLGAVVGNQFGWRTTFIGVALMAALALAGLAIGLPKGVGASLTGTTLRQRLAVVRMPGVLPALLVTTLWAMGSYTLYTFIAPYLTAVTGLQGVAIASVLFVWGLGAAIGMFFGGVANDKFGSRSVILSSLPLMVVTMASFSLSAWLLPPSLALLPVLLALGVWGVAGWAFAPAQQSSLIESTGLKSASVILSLNASFLYLGFALGSATGALVMSHSSVAWLGLAGALSEALALGLFLLKRKADAAAETV